MAACSFVPYDNKFFLGSICTGEISEELQKLVASMNFTTSRNPSWASSPSSLSSSWASSSPSSLSSSWMSSPSSLSSSWPSESRPPITPEPSSESLSTNPLWAKTEEKKEEKIIVSDEVTIHREGLWVNTAEDFSSELIGPTIGKNKHHQGPRMIVKRGHGSGKSRRFIKQKLEK